MKCSILQTFLFATTLLVVNAQVPSIGRCPNVRVMENFNPAQYLGLWYEQQKYPFVFEALGECVTARYGQNSDGTVSVVNTQLNRLTGTPSSITGRAEIVAPGKLRVTFNGVPALSSRSNYWVLSTDYETYSVVYSCSQPVTYLKAQIVWILTRERNPPPSVITRAYQVIRANNLSTSLLTRTNQVGCP